MYQLRLFGILLRPSLLSGLTVTTITLIILGVSNWSDVTHSALFYDYFFGKYGVTTALQQSDFTVLDSEFFSQTYTYDIAVLLVAILSGMLVYIVLESFSRGVSGAREAVSEIETSQGASRRSIETEIGVRWGVRIASLVLWATYTIFFMNAIIPFCILTTRTGASNLNVGYGWVYSILGFVVLWLGLHQHLIFARLTTLRPRLFGGQKVIEAELFDR